MKRIIEYRLVDHAPNEALATGVEVMSFVPFVPPSPPSPRAYELGRRLKETIDGFRQENPSVSKTEIRQAMGLATQRSGSQPVLIALALGLMLLGALGFFYYSRQSGDVDRNVMMMVIIGAGIALVALKAFLKSR